MNALEHAIYQMRNERVLTYPFPHFFVNNVFPWPFYKELLKSLPEDGDYKPLSGGYKHRIAAESIDLVKDFNSAYFVQHVLTMFGKWFYERYPIKGSTPNFRWEIRFIRDEEGYKIGPHTDAPHKVVSLLFYLPEEYDHPECGTSIYVPDDHVKTCAGGPHYGYEDFSEVWRAPFVPNSCLGFWKGENSWHGVQPIECKIRRDVMLFNIYEEKS